MWQNGDRLSQLMALCAPEQDYGVPIASGEIPGDERVHGWVRPLAEKADEARRNVEDILFIDGQPQLDDKLEIAQNTAHAAAKAMTTLQKAMGVRDQVWAELPYLITWQLNPLRVGGEQQNGEQSADPTKIIVDARQLEAKLSLPASNPDLATAEKTVSEIETLSDQLKVELSTLNGQFTADCEGCLSKKSGFDFRKIEAALANPLLTGRLRGKLDDAYLELNGKSFGPSATKQTDSSVYAHSADGWSDPLFALLTKDKTNSKTDLNTPWQNGVKLLSSDVAATVSGGKATRQDLFSIDGRMRSVAALISRDAYATSDRKLGKPVRRLQTTDLISLVLWHADRVRRDFWGPAGAGEPFALLAANDYLDSAEILSAQPHANGPAGGEPSEAAAIRSQVENEVRRLRDWLTTRANDALVLQNGDNARSKIAVSVGANETPVVPGTAAIFVEKDGQRMDGVSYTPAGSLTLPIRQIETTASIPTRGIRLNRMDLDQNLNAMTMFRGHEFRGAFHIAPLGGVVVDEVPPSYGPGRVTLRSNLHTLSVVIVLDCSQSMELPLESGKSKLSVAKDALVELLTVLSSKEDSRVGVRLFGHRLGWSVDRPVRVLKSPTYAGEIPTDLTPDADVERLLPLGDFGFKSAQRLFAALHGVEHGWGQSPLYLALNQTLTEDFAGADPNANKHVIVITDGRNYQARPTAAERATMSQVVKSAQSAGVPVHVLAFKSDASAARQDNSEFNKLASETGGTIEIIADAQHLRNTLQSLVKPELDQLSNADGKVVDRGELGVPLSDAGQHGPGWYSVAYHDISDKILLDGGEAIELFTKPEDKELHAYPFDHDVAGEAWFGSGSDEGGPLLERVHRPLSADRNVEFRISLQRSMPSAASDRANDWRWTRRPLETWVEITPLNSKGQPAAQSYPFYDTNFAPDQPVPLLDLVGAIGQHELTAQGFRHGISPRPLNN